MPSQKQNFGYYGSKYWYGFGYDYAFSVDASVDYKYPIYNNNQFFVVEPQLTFLLGGHNYVSVQLFYLRFNVILDLTGFEITPFDYTLKADVVEYSEFC